MLVQSIKSCITQESKEKKENVEQQQKQQREMLKAQC
jgi:hypothetical protein